MITVESLHIGAGNFWLEDISFHVPTGGYAALMGKTGCGKTTILEAICGLRKPSHGAIHFGDRNVTRLKPAERGLGYVPQDRALFNTMSVSEHLAFALTIRGWNASDIADRVEEMANLLGITHLLHRKPHRLSGGEAQRVALGRALSFHPQVLLLDEPLGALDADTREEMYDLLDSICQKTGVTTMHVTHDKAEAERLADRMLILRDGVITERRLRGSPDDDHVTALPASESS